MEETDASSIWGLIESVRGGLSLLETRSRFKIQILTLFRMAANILDLIGVMLIASFSYSAIKDSAVTELSSRIPLGLALSPTTALSLGVTALIFKSVLSFLLSTQIIKILNESATRLIDRRSKMLVTSTMDTLDETTSQELHYLLTAGTRAELVGVISPLSTLVSEGGLLVMFCSFLVWTNPVSALPTILLLGVTSWLLQRRISQRLYRNGQQFGSAAVSSISKFEETVEGFRELFVRGKMSSSMDQFIRVEARASSLQTEQFQLSTVPRYVLESLVVGSLGLIGLLSFVTLSLEDAVLTLAVFGATTARILPSLLPIQAAISELQTNFGKSAGRKRLIDLLSRHEIRDQKFLESQGSSVVNEPISVEFKNVDFVYPRMGTPAISGVTFRIVGPGWFALEGPSGSGKSTIFDLLLGLRLPSSGTVTICGVDPFLFIRENPGVCAYLPQKISTINGNIFDNVALGETPEGVDVEKIEQALLHVGLHEILQRPDQKSDLFTGDSGGRFSGGQIQRVGLARCLYTRPRLLLLDESVSGLDRQTQIPILDLIKDLSRSITVITISHSATVTKMADHVIGIENGKVVRNSVNHA